MTHPDVPADGGAEDETTGVVVSVVVPSYNYAGYIERAIRSAQEQTFADIEILVLDNASTDDSVDRVRALAADDPRVIIVDREENIGAVPNLIDGHRRTRGRYSVDLDADDWIVNPRAIERQVEVLDSHPDAAFVFNRVAHYATDGTAMFESGAFDSDCVVPGEVALERVTQLVVQHSGTMFRRDAYVRAGGYDARFTVQNDLKLYVDLCAQGSVAYIDEVLYAWHQHDANHSRTELFPIMLRELVDVIDAAYTGPLAGRLDDPSRMRRDALSHGLLSGPMNAVFAGHTRRAWTEIAAALRIRPSTALSRHLPIIAARTLLGQRGFTKLEGRLGRSG
ncbi:MAG: glycosyltransferase family 2 protein [Acidimicrobiia bacterium]|nr:glycosyltransferase family 2 protein [Acidimicrobiia bacterium]